MALQSESLVVHVSQKPVLVYLITVVLEYSFQPFFVSRVALEKTSSVQCRKFLSDFKISTFIKAKNQKQKVFQQLCVREQRDAYVHFGMADPV